MWRHVGERFADVNVVDRVAHGGGGGGVMVWAGVCYGQQTQVHFIDGILNAQIQHEEILILNKKRTSIQIQNSKELKDQTQKLNKVHNQNSRVQTKSKVKLKRQGLFC